MTFDNANSADVMPLALATLALAVLFLYDGSLFTRKQLRQRNFDRAERERRRYTRAEIQDTRDKARRGLLAKAKEG